MPTQQMEIRGFDIIADVQGDFKPIDAICQFLYQGHQISISTSGRSQGACQTPICIFTGDNYQDVLKNGLRTVEEAIEYIDGL